MMKKSTGKIVRSVMVALVLLLAGGSSFAQSPKFRVLAFYSLDVEKAHVEFALDAIKFFQELARQEHFAFDTTSLMSDLNEEKLKNYPLLANSVLYFETLLSKPAGKP
jgi:uncharacterized protein